MTNGITHRDARSENFLRKTDSLFTNAAVRGHLIAVVVSCLVVGLISASAHAQRTNPFSTAAEHAARVADTKELTEIHLHLQRVLNCLEGCTGRDHKKVADNPCTDKGELQTLPKGSANLVRSQKAVGIARLGVTLYDVPPTHYVAEAIHAILTEEQQR